MTRSTPTPGDPSLRRLARRRVGLQTGWMIHALVFACVNIGLFVLNSLTGGVRWHVYPLAGWGLGLAIHGLVVWLALGHWRERWVSREESRLRRGRRVSEA